MPAPPIFNPNHSPGTNPTSLEERTGLAPKTLSGLSESEKTPFGDLSNSPWAKMFPEGATQDELNMFIKIFIQSIISQAKIDDAHFKAALERQKQEAEGG